MNYKYRQLFSFFIILLSCQLAFGKSLPFNKIAVVVNNQSITTEEVSEREALIIKQMSEKGVSATHSPEVAKQVLDHMINEQLQLQIAKEMGLDIDPQTLDQAMINIAKENSMSLNDFKNKIEQEGYDYQSFRADLRRDLLIQKVQQRKLRTAVVVTDKEVQQKALQLKKNQAKQVKYHLAHILISLSEDPTPKELSDTKEKAELVMKKLQGGIAFEKLALENSDGQQALDGGDLGWRTLDELPSLFVDFVPTLKEGEVKGPIHSSSGYHLVKLLEKTSTAHSNLVPQTRVSHILLHTDAISSDAVVAKHLDVIRDKIIKGDSFESTAKTYSEDSASAAKGGDLGWLNPGDMDRTFETVMNETAVGSVSKPFKSAYGWQLIKVTDKRQQAIDGEILQEQARRMLFQKKFQEALEHWLSQLRQSAHIEYKL